MCSATVPGQSNIQLFDCVTLYQYVFELLCFVQVLDRAIVNILLQYRYVTR